MKTGFEGGKMRRGKETRPFCGNTIIKRLNKMFTKEPSTMIGSASRDSGSSWKKESKIRCGGI